MTRRVAAVLVLLVGFTLGGLLAWRGLTGPPDQSRSRLREAAGIIGITVFAVAVLWVVLMRRPGSLRRGRDSGEEPRP